MNKLVIREEEIELVEEDECLEITRSNSLDLFDIKRIEIKFLKDTILEIDDKSTKESKIDIRIFVEPSVHGRIEERRSGKQNKIQYQYFLEYESYLEVAKLYDCEQVKELNIVALMDQYAEFHFSYTTIAKHHQTFDLMVYHNHKNTKSLITNKGLTVGEGELHFHVTGMVYPGMTGCILNQKNHIINLNDSKTEIDPNLLIEEEDVQADHAAFIGTFKEELFFYLESRGIPRKQALSLLIQGFLSDNWIKKEELDTIIKALGR